MRLFITSLTLSLVAAATLFAFSAPAEAQNAYVFEDEMVIGVVQLPQVQIFITRQNLNSEYDLELKESFIPKIVESVEKKPF